MFPQNQMHIVFVLNDVKEQVFYDMSWFNQFAPK